MTPYEKFINPRYVKMFNHFLNTVVAKKFERKYHQEVTLKLYGIKIKPKNSVYSQVPIEKLSDIQAEVLFFIDTEPSKFVRDNFFDEILLVDGALFLGLSKKNIWGTDTFEVEFLYNKRPLYPLDYVVEDPVNENKLPFAQEEKNGIKTRLFKESTDNHELKWHFDQKDRKVKVVKSNGWELQMDNQLPISLTEGNIITIPKGMYHRVIKGKGDLIVKIKEY
jgi:hypothetical protein